MSYKSILVGLDTSQAATRRAVLAGDLAARFGARLTGLAGRDVSAQPIGDAIASTVVTEVELETATREFAEIEQRFRKAVSARSEVRFVSGIGSPDNSIATMARTADFVVVGARPALLAADPMTGIDPGEAVIRIGGPVLVVPESVDALHATRIVLAWSDTPECRRAVTNALPLLKRAMEVCICHAGASEEGRSVGDVADFLNRHGVHTGIRLIPKSASPISDELFSCATRAGADLIVAGAYGHNRILEWVFGGVTKDMLERSPVCCLLSH